MEFLKGSRTYIIALLIIVAGVLSALGYLSNEIRDTVVTVLLGGGLATLRAGVSKLEY